MSGPRDLGNLRLLGFSPSVVEESDGWRLASSESKYADPYVQLEINTYETPGRETPTPPWTVCHRKAAVAIAGQTTDGLWVMVEQERYPLMLTLWEFPAGQIDDLERGLEPEKLLHTILDELEEEVGYTIDTATGTVTPMGHVYSSQGYSDEHMYLFHATELVPLEQGPSPTEGESIAGPRLLTDEELRRRIADGDSVDALSLALYARLAARGVV